MYRVRCLIPGMLLLVFLWDLPFFPENTTLWSKHVFGQNTHLQNLIQVYKEQNPDAVAKGASRSRQNGANAPNTPVGPNAYPAPADATLARDPYAPGPPAPYGMPYAAPVQPVPTGVTATGSVPYPAEPMAPPVPEGPRSRETASPRTVAPGGNPRDPLNADFVPEWDRNPERFVSPYEEMLNDARLNDVFFLDGQCGWAVGDRGAIWHTKNGGKTWSLQETPIECTLRSVHFLNERQGLAVGGYYYPFEGRGRGVVLITQDGGKTWSLLPMIDFPVFHRVRMFDPMKGLLAGDSSEHCPSGLFATGDGGRSWKSVFVGKSEGWHSVDFLDEKNVLGVDRRGESQLLRDLTQLLRPELSASTRLSQVKAVKRTDSADEVDGWMVGESGLVLSTGDRGLRWSVVPGSLPGQSAAIDLNTIEARGRKLWVAGSPGTFVYFSNDSGTTWNAASTGTTATVRKIVFVSDKQGWAVGDLGTVLATKDGGRSWTRQRCGGSRLAVLGLFGRAEDIPFEAFVQICANQGYLGGASLLLREESNDFDSGESARLERIHEAMLRTGASGAGEIGPYSLERREFQTTLERLVERIRQQDDGKGLQRLRERLVATLRQWKPDVVLTSAAPASGNDPVKEFVLREVMQAIRAAEDPTAFPAQTTELGLAPWKVRKVHLVLEEGAFGDVNITTTEPLIRLGGPIDELAFVSRGLVEGRYKPGPTILGFSTPVDETPSDGGRHFFSGIELLPGGEARRELRGSYQDHWEEIRERIQLRRRTRDIMENASRLAEQHGRRAGDVRLASHAEELTRKIDRDAAVRILLELGRQCHRDGNGEAAREAYDILTKQYGTHPLARHGFLWLLNFYASEEIGRRLPRTNESVISQTTFDGRGNQRLDEVRTVLSDRKTGDARADKAIAIGRYLERHYPDLADDARVRFAVASVLRRIGLERDALRYYRSRGNMKFDDVWGMRARAESWLAVEDKSELPPGQRELPLPSIVCSFTPTKPYLDGKFDKSFDKGTWFGGKLYTLTPEKPRRRLREMLREEAGTAAPENAPGVRREEKSVADSNDLGTQAMFLYDKEYLYIGLRARRSAGFSYPPVAEKPRARDVDVGDRDRVEILIDVDRDYGSYYSLTVDSRGWVVDACCGDTTWNPGWYVARHEDKDAWYVEAAIPFESLTERVPVPNTVWGVGLRRIVPGVGIECWNAENSFDLTEGIGFLVFE